MNSIKDIRYYKLFKRTAFQYPDQHKLLHRKVFYFPYNEMLNVFTFLSTVSFKLLFHVILIIKTRLRYFLLLFYGGVSIV
jgi:hypothetical protein